MIDWLIDFTFLPLRGEIYWLYFTFLPLRDPRRLFLMMSEPNTNRLLHYWNFAFQQCSSLYSSANTAHCWTQLGHHWNSRQQWLHNHRDPRQGGRNGSGTRAVMIEAEIGWLLLLTALPIPISLPGLNPPLLVHSKLCQPRTFRKQAYPRETLIIATPCRM